MSNHPLPYNNYYYYYYYYCYYWKTAEFWFIKELLDKEKRKIEV
jgi:hypothetical protein